jgi:hypothetical protein
MKPPYVKPKPGDRIDGFVIVKKIVPDAAKRHRFKKTVLEKIKWVLHQDNGSDIPVAVWRIMNLPVLKGGVSCKRCIIYEVRSVRKLFNCGVCCHFLLALPNVTALKGGVLDPTANKINEKAKQLWPFKWEENWQEIEYKGEFEKLKTKINY